MFLSAVCALQLTFFGALARPSGLCAIFKFLIATCTESPLVRCASAGGNPLFLIAGPFVMGKKRSTRADHGGKNCKSPHAEVPYIFKSSYDKAHLSSVKLSRGPGLKEGLRILANQV